VISRSSDSADLNKSSTHENKKEARSSDRSKKKSSWYNVLYPTYKSRSEDFKRIFKDVPDDERLVVGKYCFFSKYFKSAFSLLLKNVLCSILFPVKYFCCTNFIISKLIINLIS